MVTRSQPLPLEADLRPTQKQSSLNSLIAEPETPSHRCVEAAKMDESASPALTPPPKPLAAPRGHAHGHAP